MLNTVLRDNQAHFPVVLREATQCLPLVFGVYVNKVDPGERIYFLVPTLGLTLNEMQRDGQSMPKAGLLVMDLSLILLAGDLTLRRRSREHSTGWGCVSGVSTTFLGAQGAADPSVGTEGVPGVPTGT